MNLKKRYVTTNSCHLLSFFHIYWHRKLKIFSRPCLNRYPHFILSTTITMHLYYSLLTLRRAKTCHVKFQCTNKTSRFWTHQPPAAETSRLATRRKHQTCLFMTTLTLGLKRSRYKMGRCNTQTRGKPSRHPSAWRQWRYKLQAHTPSVHISPHQRIHRWTWRQYQTHIPSANVLHQLRRHLAVCHWRWWLKYDIPMWTILWPRAAHQTTQPHSSYHWRRIVKRMYKHLDCFSMRLWTRVWDNR